ncbi:hypothetical protein JB92DRAFT_2919267 [Gautieria morchelliformis]|nr:hypothetical protein JB92DRAFT_2919267 [Gautieria morchelliformis]
MFHLPICYLPICYLPICYSHLAPAPALAPAPSSSSSLTCDWTFYKIINMRITIIIFLDKLKDCILIQWVSPSFMKHWTHRWYIANVYSIRLRL